MACSMRLLLIVAILLGGPTASAAVVASGVGGFIVREEVLYPGERSAAWLRLVRIEDWWSSEHTYSGSSSNLCAVRCAGAPLNCRQLC